MTFAAQAQQQTCPTAALTNAPDFRLDLGPYACVYSDPDRTLTLQDVLDHGMQSRFAPAPGGLIDFGFGSDRYWVRVTLMNATDTPGTWPVTHDIPLAERLEVSLIRSGTAPEPLLDLRSDDPFDARSLSHRHLVSEVFLAAGETAEMIISYTSHQPTEMPLFVEASEHFLDRVQTETAAHLSLSALIIGIGLISTAYLFGFDGPRAFVYGAYILSGAGLLVHMEGYGFQYLWPLWPAFNYVALPLFAMGTVAFGLVFVARLTETGRQTPRLHRAVVVTVSVLAFGAALAPIFMKTALYKTAFTALFALAAMLQLVVIASALRRGHPGAWLLLIGFGALTAALSFGALGYLTQGLFQQELAGTAIRTGFALEAAAFSAAIALRIRAARLERDAYLQSRLRDSEERLRLSEALRHAEEDRLKARAALRNAAHDIRQPLASMQMALASGDVSQDRISGSLDYIQDIVRTGLEGTGQRPMGQENTAAPLGTGETDPPPGGAEEVFAMQVVLDNVAGMFAQDAATSGIELRVVPCSEHLRADPLAVMRMLSNLTSNALRHSGAERVLVGCRRKGNRLHVQVHDDGQGMSQPELDRLQARGARGGGSDGYGLGLDIVKQLAVSRGYQFTLTSDQGRGTIAAFTLARARYDPSHVTPDADELGRK